MTFQDIITDPDLLQALEELGFETPTEIQQKAIPLLTDNYQDFIGLAQTGTGKTASFGLPLISNRKGGAKKPFGLVVAPTRELANQITKDIQTFAQFKKGFRVIPVYGGTDIRKQKDQIRRGVDVVVATPGRLLDLIRNKSLSISDVDTLVFDEADEMLNMGFLDDIKQILELTEKRNNTWLFSATMPNEIKKVVQRFMDSPEEVTVGRKNEGASTVAHEYYVVKERDRLGATKQILDSHPGIYGVIFANTKVTTQKVADELYRAGYDADALHGDLTQSQRDFVMGKFKDKKLQILVATDVAARGIDVSNVTHVIHYHLPDDVENYTHRSGRTGRAGRTGTSIAIINPKEGGKIKRIEKIINKKFDKQLLPDGKDICNAQLSHLIQKVIDTEVNTSEIEDFNEMISDGFAHLTKEQVIQKFLITEFNRFINDYKFSDDLNYYGATSSEDRGGRGRDRGRRDSRLQDTQRFHIKVGEKDNFNKGALVRVVCDATGLSGSEIGRIDIFNTYTFFETEKKHKDLILSALADAEYDGREFGPELANPKGGGGNRGGRDKRSGGNRGGRDFKGNRRSGGGSGHRGGGGGGRRRR